MKKTHREPYCLVLSGGGAKGMYHIGVWRALREMEVPVNAFIGNSIGAVISAILAQGLYDELEEIGDRIDIGWVVNLPAEMVKDGALSRERPSMKTVRRLSRDIAKHRSLDTSPFHDLVHNMLNEDAIRQSGVDLGVITVNVSDMQVREVFLEEMEPGSLGNYVLASAAFPGFEQPVIGGKKHIDGGFANNLPYDLATSRGYRRIIVSDISGMGINRRIRSEGTNTVIIKISADIGGILDFHRSTLEQLRTLGYLDTLKAFGRLVGREYFIVPDDGKEAAFRDYLRAELGDNYRSQLRLHRILPPRLRNERRLLYPLLDCAAEALGLDRMRQYTYNELSAAILQGRNLIEQSLAAPTDREQRSFMRSARRILRGRAARGSLKRTSWEYLKLFTDKKDQEAGLNEWSGIVPRTLRAIYPELPGADFILNRIESISILSPDTHHEYPDPGRPTEQPPQS